jgi:hypothetical protein
MANQHLFFAGKMGSQQLDVLLANAYIVDGEGEGIEAPDGGLVELKELHADDTYSATGLQYDVYDATKPTAEPEDLALIDYAGVSEGEIAGNEYKIGIKLYNLNVPANTITRVRRPMLHDKFWLGADNFDFEPAIGDLAGVKADDFKHTQLQEAAGYTVKVRIARELTTGTRSQGKMFLVEVVSL